MNTHRAPSTQEAHPWRSVVRTFVAAAVGVVLAWLVRVLGVDLTALSQPIIDSLTAAAWAVGTGHVQWVLTRPWAQPALEAVGLGTGVHVEQQRLVENVQRSQGGDG
jgi:hypothetical protein